MNKLWDENSWSDYVDWQHQDNKIVERINLLIKDIAFQKELVSLRN